MLNKQNLQGNTKKITCCMFIVKTVINVWHIVPRVHYYCHWFVIHSQDQYPFVHLEVKNLFKKIGPRWWCVISEVVLCLLVRFSNWRIDGSTVEMNSSGLASSGLQWKSFHNNCVRSTLKIQRNIFDSGITCFLYCHNFCLIDVGSLFSQDAFLWLVAFCHFRNSKAIWSYFKRCFCPQWKRVWHFRARTLGEGFTACPQMKHFRMLEAIYNLTGLHQAVTGLCLSQVTWLKLLIVLTTRSSITNIYDIGLSPLFWAHIYLVGSRHVGRRCSRQHIR